MILQFVLEKVPVCLVVVYIQHLASILILLVGFYGCDSIVTTNLTISDIPDLIISGSQTVQEGQTENYTVTNTNGSSYNWSLSSGAIITGGEGSNGIY